MNAPSAHFIAVCPSCLSGLRVNYEYSGRLVRCRHCNEAFRPFTPDFDSDSAEYAVGPVAAAEDQPDLVVSCPECATTLSVRARYAGRHVRCGGCQHKFRVDPAAAAPLERLADVSDSADADEPTPDPDAKRSDLSRLVEEVAALRDGQAHLVRRCDELKRRVDELDAQVLQLEADREAAERLIAGLTDRLGRGGAVDDRATDDLRPAALPFRSERSAANGR